MSIKLCSDIVYPCYPNPESIVYNPSVPYRGCIPNGLHDGKLIEIRGSVPYGANTFAINLLTGIDPTSDRAFHMSVRFHERVVVRNTSQYGTWGDEERNGNFPFHTGRDFYIMILVEPMCYRVAVDHKHLFEFSHRIPMSRVTSIFIDGSVKIERIEFIDKQIPRSARIITSNPSICPSTATYPSPLDLFPPGMPRIDPYFDPVSARYAGYRNPGFPSTTCQPIPSAIPFPNPGIVIPPPEQQISICPQPAFPTQPSVAICPQPAFPTQPSVSICPQPAFPTQPATTVSSNLAPVYNPSIPYAYPIYGGLKPGMMIYISGRPSASAYRFNLNFQAGTSPYPPPDIAFHVDVRFTDHTIVRNSRINNGWEREETIASHFPFQLAVNFDMIIRVEHDKYMVALNGQHFLEFRHRHQPLSRFDTLYIDGDIVVSSIRFA